MQSIVRLIRPCPLFLLLLAFLSACAPSPTPTPPPTFTPPPTTTSLPTVTPTATTTNTPTATASPTREPLPTTAPMPPSVFETQVPKPTATVTEKPTTVPGILGTGKWAGEVRRLQVFSTDIGNHDLYQAVPYDILEVRNPDQKKIISTLIGEKIINGERLLHWIWLDQSGATHYYYTHLKTKDLDGAFSVPNTRKVHMNDMKGVEAQDLSPGIIFQLGLSFSDFEAVQNKNGQIATVVIGVAMSPGQSMFTKMQTVPPPEQ